MNGGDGLGSLDLSGMGGGDFSSGPRMSLMGGSNGQMGALPPASSAAAAVAAAAAAGHGSASRAMPGGNGVPPPPGGPARSDGSAEQRRYAIQQQLMLLIHAYKCKLPVAEEAKPGEPYCQVRFCSIMKKVLQHMSKCQLGRKCNGKQDGTAVFSLNERKRTCYGMLRTRAERASDGCGRFKAELHHIKD